MPSVYYTEGAYLPEYTVSAFITRAGSFGGISVIKIYICLCIKDKI